MSCNNCKNYEPNPAPEPLDPVSRACGMLTLGGPESQAVARQLREWADSRPLPERPWPCVYCDAKDAEISRLGMKVREMDATITEQRLTIKRMLRWYS